MFTRVMRRPPVQRTRPVELSKEAQAIAKASVSASAKVKALSSFETCNGCVAKKMCKKSSCCMYGQSKPKENKNAKNG